MSKKDEVKKIWTECFSDSREWVDMFFSSVYTDDEALLLTDPSGMPVSSLMLQRYTMSFHGEELPVSYIAGAATRRSQRGRGYMSSLMRLALEESAGRGDMMCSLIPASEALFYFYRRYGFTTVFYIKEQRFTSFHTFPVEGSYGVYDNVSDPTDDRLWEAFDRFQRARSCYVLHNREQFEAILADVECSGGIYTAIQNSEGEIVSMAWGGPLSDDMLLVTDVMGANRDARGAALRQLRGSYGGYPVLLYGHPDDSMGGRLIPRAMGRVVNVSLALEAIARAYPKLSCRIRVKDPLLPHYNSHIFVVGGGECVINDGFRGVLDFDLDISVFTDILFSSEKTGDILRFPSCRPMISLMLDSL